MKLKFTNYQAKDIFKRIIIKKEELLEKITKINIKEHTLFKNINIIWKQFDIYYINSI